MPDFWQVAGIRMLSKKVLGPYMANAARAKQRTLERLLAGPPPAKKPSIYLAEVLKPILPDANTDAKHSELARAALLLLEDILNRRDGIADRLRSELLSHQKKRTAKARRQTVCFTVELLKERGLPLTTSETAETDEDSAFIAAKKVHPDLTAKSIANIYYAERKSK
jgi:hypothetical protein